MQNFHIQDISSSKYFLKLCNFVNLPLARINKIIPNENEIND